jgi:hypothetical protein
MVKFSLEKARFCRWGGVLILQGFAGGMRETLQIL